MQESVTAYGFKIKALRDNEPILVFKNEGGVMGVFLGYNIFV